MEVLGAAALVQLWGLAASEATTTAPTGGVSDAGASDAAESHTGTGGGRGGLCAGEGISSRFAPAAVAPAPLYDAEALQLWLLQCCQVVRRSLSPARGASADVPPPLRASAC